MTGTRTIRNTLVALALCGTALAAPASAQDVQPPLPPFLPPPVGSAALPPNTVLPPVPREDKRWWAQLMMRFNPLSMRDMLNLMADKVPVRPGLSVDQVVEALIARAERHGFTLVHRYRLWQDLEARTGASGTPKVEIISLCDPLVSRDWLDHAPEMVLFVPPRIAVLEDRDGRYWLMMLDWDMRWLDTAPQHRLDPGLRIQGLERREMLADILRAAANGER